MLSSIHPLGERAKGNRFAVTAGAYLVGSLVGGLALGALAGLAGRVPAWLLGLRGSMVVIAALALVGMGVDAGWWRLPYPSWRRQVDEEWLHRYRGWVYGAGFGVQLGFGLVTIITSASTWVMVVAATLQPTWAAAVAVGGVFGLVRGLGILEAATIGGTTELAGVHRRMSSRAAPAKWATVVAMGLGAVALGAGALVGA